MTAPMAPTFKVPASPGLLSNKRGSNTGADAISHQVTYSNPKASNDLAGSISVVCQRTVTQGTDQTPEDCWISGWVGNPATSAAASTSWGVATYGGRVYYAGTGFASVGTPIYSFPLSGANCGTHRVERVFPRRTSATGVVTQDPITALAVAGAYLYAFVKATGNIWVASIASDGKLGAWTVQSGPSSGAVDTYLIGDPNGKWLLTIPADTTGALVPQTVVINADGSLPGAASWVATVSPAVKKLGAGVLYDPNLGQIFMVGGDDGANTVSLTTTWNTVAAATGTLGAGWSAGAPLPAVRTRGAIVMVRSGSTQNAYWMGGGSTVAAGVVGTAQATVWQITMANITGGANAWSVSAQALPVAQYFSNGASGFVTSNHWSNAALQPWIGVIGGSAGTAVPIVPSDMSSAFVSGSVTPIVAGTLGTGGARVDNQDGTQDFTFAYGAFGQAMAFSFADGDAYQIYVQFADSTGGDPSIQWGTLVKVGQPPTIASASTSGSGQPVDKWTYVSGAGGAGQQSWQLQVKSGATVLYDSGVQQNRKNSVSGGLIAPMLPPSVSFDHVITVASSDQVMPGSSNTGTTTVSAAPVFAVAGPPTAPSATADNVNAKVTVGWTNTNPAPDAIRIYYRLNSVGGAWFLLVENLPAVGAGAAQSVDLMDELALGVGYDFGVASETIIGVTNANESSLVTAGTNVKIDSVAGGYSACLHVQGDTTTKVTLKLRKPPDFQEVIDTHLAEVFGTMAPLARFGVGDYRTVSMEVFLPATADLKLLQAVLKKGKAGSILVYRDGYGHQFTVVPTAKQSLRPMPPLYRTAMISLVQVPNTRTPNAGIGSGRGMRPLVNGNLDPLDTSEFAI